MHSDLCPTHRQNNAIVALVLLCGTASASDPWAQAASTSSGQAYPVKPVRVIVTFPAGGGIDTVTRLLAPKLTETLSQQTICGSKSEEFERVIPTISPNGRKW
jgi:tripartite-type tricarboxylate transporter receptor subunit TctC